MADPIGPGIVDGTDGGDLIETGFTDSESDAVGAGNDVISAGDGDDTVRGGAGADEIYGGGDDDDIEGNGGADEIFGGDGSDTIDGGAGNDTIHGGNPPEGEVTGRASFNWSDLGEASEADLATTYTQDTGEVSVTFTEESTDGIESIYVPFEQNIGGIDGGTETVDAFSGMESQGNANGENAAYSWDFSESVSNVDFRINDIDHHSVVQITAYDADGNEIPVTLTASGTTDLILSDDDAVTGDETATATGNDGANTSENNSILVEIAGPVARIEVTHAQVGIHTSHVVVTDMFFDTISQGDDEDEGDELNGGIGMDVIDGGAGDDTIDGGEDADTMTGGDDRDTFVNITIGDVIDGSEGGDDHDTINLTGVNPGGSVVVEYDPLNDENGTIHFLDGDEEEIGTATFTNIEDIICFTPNTGVLTPSGEVAVQDLKVGDRVVTRDNGLQTIRWVGRKRLDGRQLLRMPHLRPIMIRKGSLGPNLPDRDLMVSPSHRMLMVNQQSQLLFNESEVLAAAKHLTHVDGVKQVSSVGVDYIHFLCDNHEVVLANGAWSETFQPGEYSLDGMDSEQRNEIFELFPELESDEGLAEYHSARITLKRHEAQLIG